MARRGKKQREARIWESVTVVDTGAKGKSIGRSENGVVLIDGALPGDVVDVRITKMKKGLAEGQAFAFHTLSPDRVQPICPHFDYCGGCTWQHLRYEAQLAFKEKSVRDAMERIGRLREAPIRPILPSPRNFYYRNRLDFAFTHRRWVPAEDLEHAGDIEEWRGLGFHVQGRFDKVFDISRCYLQPDPSNNIRLAVREWAIAHGYSFYDLRDGGGSLRSLIVRTATTGEVMVIVVFFEEKQERIRKLMDFIKDRFPSISSLYYVLNNKANDTLYDRDHHLYHGKPHLTEDLLGVRYEVGPKSFFQTNPWGAATLFGAALEMAQLQPDDLVYDLYTGVGSIALPAAKLSRKVVGIETVAEAIDFAKVNAQNNGIVNASFYAGDVKDLLTRELLEREGYPDVIITDPPRIGMDRKVVEALLEVAPQRLVYVSCNPATQARDIEWLSPKYHVEALQPVDMFPHTAHVENVALMVRQDS